MAVLPLVVGFVVAASASAVVYADAMRSELPPNRRLGWSGVVGAASFVGFLLPVLFDDRFRRAYLHAVKPEPIVASPLEILAVHLVVGIGISASVAFLYRLGRTPRRSDAE